MHPRVGLENRIGQTQIRVGLESIEGNDGRAWITENALCGETSADYSGNATPAVVECPVQLLGRYVVAQRKVIGVEMDIAEIEVDVTNRKKTRSWMT